MYFVFVVIASICGLISCEPFTDKLGKTINEISNNSVIGQASDAVKGFANDAMNEISSNSVKKMASDVGKTLSESVDDFGAKVKEAMDDILDQDLSSSEDLSTEFQGIDATGCDRGFRKRLEDDCDTEYERANEEAQQIEEDREKTESVCCALEDFEKCSLRAYDRANCATDKAAIRENLKAARLFLSVVGNITCTEFRGQCAFYSSATVGYSASYVPVLLSSLVSALLF